MISGEHSSLKTYLIAGFVAAVSGAIFSPVQAIKSLGGMLILGAAAGAFESGITQLLEMKCNLKIRSFIFRTVCWGIEGR